MKPFFCLYRIVLHFSCLTFPNWCSFHTLATRWQQWRALTSQLFKTFSHFLFLFMWWRDVRGAGTSSMLRIQFLMLSKDFSLVMSYTSMMPCNIKTGNDLSTGRGRFEKWTHELFQLLFSDETHTTDHMTAVNNTPVYCRHNTAVLQYYCTDAERNASFTCSHHFTFLHPPNYYWLQ